MRIFARSGLARTIVAMAVAWAGLTGSAGAATFSVTSTADSGAGSLRQALLDVAGNCGTGPHTIAFNINGAGPHSITPATALPALSCAATVLDGYTQPQNTSAAPASVNLDTGATNNANLLVILNGSGCTGCNGLTISGTDVIVRGLSIHSFSGAGIEIADGANFATVEGNYIGTDPGGMTALGNGDGVRINNANNVTIGGSNVSKRNLITANTDAGIDAPGSTIAGLIIRNNQIGGNRSGGTAIGNGGSGIYSNSLVSAVSNIRITNNWVVGNYEGIYVRRASIVEFNKVHGHAYIGITLYFDGNTAKGNEIYNNASDGIWITDANSSVEDNSIYNNGQYGLNIWFGPTTVSNNTIFGNTSGGINVSTTGSVSILGTRSYGNNGLSGILFDGSDATNDYSATPPTPPHDGDTTGDGGPQNHPELSSVIQAGGNTTVNGALRTNGLNQTYRIELFSNSTAGVRDGQVFEDSFVVSTDANGELTFSRVLAGAKTHITATATRLSAPVETSPYSPAMAAVVSGPLNLTVSFAPSSVVAGAVATLTFTFANSGATAATVSPAVFSYPTGLVNATVPGASSTCSGATASASPGGTSVAMSSMFTVAAGASCVLSVSVKSITPANYTVTVAAGALSSSVGSNSLTASGTLTVTPPTLRPTVAISFVPTSAPVGGTAVLRIEVTNPNAAPVAGWGLTVNYPTGLVNAPTPNASASSGLCSTNSSFGVAPGGSFVSWSTTGAGVGPNETCVLQVSVTSAAVASYTVTVAAGDLTNAVGGNTAAVSAALSIGLPPPSATLTPATLDFGSVTIGFSSGPQSLILTNTSNTTPLNVTSINSSGPFSFVAGGSCALGSPLPPLTNCVLSYQFSPVALGTFNNTVSIVTDAGTLSAALTGVGQPVPTPSITFLPGPLDFGSVPPGNTGGPLQLTLRNSGTGGLSVSSISATPPFTVELGSPIAALAPPADSAKAAVAAFTCPTGGFFLSAGGECTMNVRFAPTAPGAQAGVIQVISTLGTSTLALSGQGGVGKAVTVTPTAVNFGSVVFRGEAGARSLTLKSTGFQPVTLNRVELVTGAGATAAELSDFTLQHNCGILQPEGAAGDACMLSVNFKPSALGPRAADVRIAGDFEGGVLSVPLDGVGTPSPVPYLAFSASSFGFGQQGIGVGRTTPMVISNAGQAPVNLSAIYALGDFFVQHNCPTSLPAGSSCTVFTGAAPVVPGLRVGFLVIESNADGGTARIPLEATGCRFFSIRDARQLTGGC